MRFNLKEEITDISVLVKNYFVRDGYVFSAWRDNPKVFDVLVVKQPCDAVGNTRYYPDSTHSLQEHIRLINEEKIERALIIAEDISFVTQCPSLKMFSVFPAISEDFGFDYSPLYGIPEIKSLNCQTIYGEKEEKVCSVDYSKISGLTELSVYGKGHLNYDAVDTLEKLWASNIKQCEDLYRISRSGELKELTVLQCGIKSLNGIEQYTKLQSLDLSYNRALSDISMLEKISGSLRLLDIHSCAKITDFSCLSSLSNLEHLSLYGSNKLPDLRFLKKMPKLKTFTFSMEVADGDLTPCLKIPYVSCSKNRKWYTLKDRDLPKNKPTKPFKII